MELILVVMEGVFFATLITRSLVAALYVEVAFAVMVILTAPVPLMVTFPLLGPMSRKSTN